MVRVVPLPAHLDRIPRTKYFGLDRQAARLSCAVALLHPLPLHHLPPQLDLNAPTYTLQLMSNDYPKIPDISWLTPQLDLHTQLRQEQDRRAAARLSRDELAILIDKLILDWYTHSNLIDNLLGRVRCLEVELALSSAPPASTEPSEEHYRWAAELLSGKS